MSKEVISYPLCLIPMEVARTDANQKLPRMIREVPQQAGPVGGAIVIRPLWARSCGFQSSLILTQRQLFARPRRKNMRKAPYRAATAIAQPTVDLPSLGEALRHAKCNC